MSTHPENRPVEPALTAPEPGGALPLLEAHVRAFVALCERGLDNTSAIAGWHGTSLESMELLLRRGSLAASPVQHLKAAPGHLFFYAAKPEDFETSAQRELRPDGRPGACLYAESTAQFHFLMREVGLDITDSAARLRGFEAVRRISERRRTSGATQEALGLGIQPDRVKSVLSELFERKGFLVALSKAAVERHPVSHGDIPGDDQKIFVPQGLSFDCIAGIEPLGVKEYEFFEALQRSIEQSDLHTK